MYNGYYYGFDMTYLVLVVPALLIALIAQIQVKSAFSRYAGVRCMSGLTGAQAAQRILQANGITDVRIEHISGKLTDHFDPQAKVIRSRTKCMASRRSRPSASRRTRRATPCSTRPITRPSASARPSSRLRASAPISRGRCSLRG